MLLQCYCKLKYVLIQRFLTLQKNRKRMQFRRQKSKDDCEQSQPHAQVRLSTHANANPFKKIATYFGASEFFSDASMAHLHSQSATHGWGDVVSYQLQQRFADVYLGICIGVAQCAHASVSTLQHADQVDVQQHYLHLQTNTTRVHCDAFPSNLPPRVSEALRTILTSATRLSDSDKQTLAHRIIQGQFRCGSFIQQSQSQSLPRASSTDSGVVTNLHELCQLSILDFDEYFMAQFVTGITLALSDCCQPITLLRACSRCVCRLWVQPYVCINALVEVPGLTARTWNRRFTDGPFLASTRIRKCTRNKHATTTTVYVPQKR